MKHTIYNLLAAAALSFCAVCFVSCGDQLNPKPEQVPSVDFDLRVSELRQSHTFEWNVAGNKIGIDPAEQELQELWVTKWNTCTVFAIGKEPSFQGVNFSSSNPKSVRINKVDGNRATLEWVGDSDTPVTITASAGDYTHSFQVYSKDVIRLAGVEFFHDFYLDGNETRDVAKATEPNEFGEFMDFTGWSPVQPDLKWNERGPIHVRIGKLVPENASFRYVVKTDIQENVRNSEDRMMKDFVPNGLVHKDFSEFQGKETYLNKNDHDIRQGDYILFYFNVDSKEPVNKENRISGFYYTWRNH